MKTGLFFGSFNPVHIGHLAIANYMVEYTGIGQLWFVISPHSPFKKRANLLDDRQRLELVHRAIRNENRFRVSDIEFRMPQPSYTIDTLTWLQEKNPGHEFILIMGSDGLRSFGKWKNAAEIIRQYTRYVYPRPGFPVNEKQHENLKVVNAPLMEISSSFIRKAIMDGKDVRHFLPQAVWTYIDEMNFYRK